MWRLLGCLALCACVTESAKDGGVDAGRVDSGSDAGVGDAGRSDEPDAAVDDAGTVRTFVYVSGSGPVRVLAFSDGGLQPVGSFEAGANPSFLAIDEARARLYAINEGGAGSTVTAVALDPETGLGTRLNTAVVGTGPAHVSLDQRGRWVLVANYGGGSVTVVEVTDAGVGRVADAETPGSRAHQIVVDASNTVAFVPCLGVDLVAQFRFDAATGGLTPNGVLHTAPGAGPRHLALHPSGRFAFLVNELDSTVQALAVEDGGLRSLQTLSTLPAGSSGANSGAEVVVHPNGGHVYTSNRGHDSVAHFRVDAQGLLTLVGHTPTGRTPRSFAVDASGQWMLVANQDSATVTVFALDAAGVPQATGQSVAVNAPAFVGFGRLRQ